MRLIKILSGTILLMSALLNPGACIKRRGKQLCGTVVTLK